MILKMKKISTYLLAFGLFTFSSCGDYLDTSPPTTLTEADFYKTPEHAYTALVACYDGLQIIWSGTGIPVVAEILSDNAFGGGGNSDGFGYNMIDEFNKETAPAEQNFFENNWKDYYRAVYRCNRLLQRMDGIDWTGQEELRAVYESEARFIRAFLYFDMVRLWGNIPLLTEPTAENVEQSSADDVYALIADDLKFAVANLPGVPYGEQAAAGRGRATKWAAESLLARVFLYYTGYYGQTDLVGKVTQADALGYVEDVIANSGHGLVEDFANLWPAASLDDYAGEDNQETIFAIKYTFTSDYDGNTDGNHWMIMNGMREQFSFPYGNGWGFSTMNPALWDAYNDGDTRQGATLIAIEEEQIEFDKIENQRQYTGYYNKKYSPMVDEAGQSLAVKMGGVNFMIGQFQDYVAIRYSDVLLMAAELGSPNAQDYFDEVRERALGNAFSSIPATKANILEERRLEFAGEGLRYWDLLRTGVDNAAAVIAETTTLLSGGVETDVVISEQKIKEKMGLQQIPYNQITLSGGKLEQNEGW